MLFAVRAADHTRFQLNGRTILAFPTVHTTQYEARERCKAEGGFLAAAYTEAEAIALVNAFPASSGTAEIWIGLAATNSVPTTIRANFLWYRTGVTPTWVGWAPLEPYEAYTEGVCVVTYANTPAGSWNSPTKWNDARCSYSAAFACEIGKEGATCSG